MENDMLFDGFGRKIEYLRISVTDRCNLRCRYCMPKGGAKLLSHDDILRHEEIARIAKILAKMGIRKVRLTGGEPLLRKNITELIKMLKQTSGIEKVYLTTNGILLGKMADALTKAGLDGVNVSLDTLDEARFSFLTRSGGEMLAAIKDGLKKVLADGRLKVKLNCVPLHGINEAEIAEIAALAKVYPVKVRFIRLMPLGCAKDGECCGMTLPEVGAILEKSFGKMAKIKLNEAAQGPAEYFSLDGFCGLVGFIDAIDSKFCQGCNRLRLTADGFLKLCLNAKDGADIKTLLRQNISDGELKKILCAAIVKKPQEHFFGSGDSDRRQMFQIGG
jgi:cyclic pyranopterin phosphate synthase